MLYYLIIISSYYYVVNFRKISILYIIILYIIYESLLIYMCVSVCLSLGYFDILELSASDGVPYFFRIDVHINVAYSVPIPIS